MMKHGESQVALWCLSLKATGVNPFTFRWEQKQASHLIWPLVPSKAREVSWSSPCSVMTLSVGCERRRSQEPGHREKSDNVYTRAVSSEWLSVSRRQLTNTVFAATLRITVPCRKTSDCKSESNVCQDLSNYPQRHQNPQVMTNIVLDLSTCCSQTLRICRPGFS